MKNRKALTYIVLAITIVFFLYLVLVVFYPSPGESENLNKVRTVLELFSFAGSFLLLPIAILGLKQLQYAKKEIEITRDIFRTQSKRNAYEAAANECRNFSDNIMPLIHELEEFVTKNNISYFEDAKIKEIKGDSKRGFRIDMSAVNKEQIVKFSEIQDVLTKYMNGMELFALYFVSRIADENIAF